MLQGHPYQISFEIENRGKFVQGSNKKVSWNFGFSPAPENYEVTLTMDLVSGKRIIHENGTEVIAANVSSKEFSHGWISIFSKRFFRIEAFSSLTSTHEFIFSIDGIRYTEFPVEPVEKSLSIKPLDKESNVKTSTPPKSLKPFKITPRFSGSNFAQFTPPTNTSGNSDPFLAKSSSSSVSLERFHDCQSGNNFDSFANFNTPTSLQTNFDPLTSGFDPFPDTSTKTDPFAISSDLTRGKGFDLFDDYQNKNLNSSKSNPKNNERDPFKSDLSQNLFDNSHGPSFGFDEFNNDIPKKSDLTPSLSDLFDENAPATDPFAQNSLSIDDPFRSSKQPVKNKTYDLFDGDSIDQGHINLKSNSFQSFSVDPFANPKTSTNINPPINQKSPPRKEKCDPFSPANRSGCQIYLGTGSYSNVYYCRRNLGAEYFSLFSGICTNGNQCIECDGLNVSSPANPASCPIFLGFPKTPTENRYYCGRFICADNRQCSPKNGGIQCRDCTGLALQSPVNKAGCPIKLGGMNGKQTLYYCYRKILKKEGSAYEKIICGSTVIQCSDCKGIEEYQMHNRAKCPVFRGSGALNVLFFCGRRINDRKCFEREENQCPDCRFLTSGDEEEIDLNGQFLIAVWNEDHRQVDRFLLNSNIDINYQDSDGRACLHLAAKRGNLELLEKILSRRPNINVQDSNGENALHMAAASGELKVVKKLLQMGCDDTCRNIDGKVPRDFTDNKAIRALLRMRLPEVRCLPLSNPVMKNENQVIESWVEAQQLSAEFIPIFQWLGVRTTSDLSLLSYEAFLLLSYNQKKVPLRKLEQAINLILQSLGKPQVDFISQYIPVLKAWLIEHDFNEDLTNNLDRIGIETLPQLLFSITMPERRQTLKENLKPIPFKKLDGFLTNLLRISPP